MELFLWYITRALHSFENITIIYNHIPFIYIYLYIYTYIYYLFIFLFFNLFLYLIIYIWFIFRFGKVILKKLNNSKCFEPCM